MTKIEEVARALCPDAWHQSIGPSGTPYFTLVLWDIEQARALKQAERAIAAMRQPTPFMLSKIEYDAHGWGENNWRAMIDAALAEPQEPAQTARNNISAKAIG